MENKGFYIGTNKSSEAGFGGISDIAWIKKFVKFFFESLGT